MRLSRISAQVISPVRPSPPTVAWNSASSGTQTIRSPLERRSSSRVTWAPNVPARWWFLPWMSFAMAPPTETQRVPGTTGRNQPCGTMSARISASVTPGLAPKQPGLGVERDQPVEPAHVQQQATVVEAAVPVAPSAAVRQDRAGQPLERRHVGAPDDGEHVGRGGRRIPAPRSVGTPRRAAPVHGARHQSARYSTSATRAPRT